MMKCWFGKHAWKTFHIENVLIAFCKKCGKVKAH